MKYLKTDKKLNNLDTNLKGNSMIVVFYILGSILTVLIISAIISGCKRKSANRIENSEYYPIWKEALDIVKEGKIVKVSNKHFIIDNKYKVRVRDNKFFCDLTDENENIIEGYEALDISYQVFDIIRKNYPYEHKPKKKSLVI